MSTVTKQIFDTLMMREAVTPGMIAALKNVSEDQFFDAKSGKTEKPGEVLREYITGFANAEGGFLVFGLADNPPRRVEPFVPPGKATLIEWATNSYAPLLAFPTSSHPRFSVVETDDGPLLFAAIARSEETLIPTVKDKRLQYFLRAGASTVALSDVTVADLLYGRRSRPVLQLSIDKSQVGVNAEQCSQNIPMVSVGFGFQVENLGFVDAERVEVGVIGWSAVNTARPLNSHLKTFIELHRPQPERAFTSSLDFLHPVYRRTSRASGGAGERDALRVPAFESGTTFGTGDFQVPLCNGRTTFTFGAFLRTERGLPTWHLLTLQSQYTGLPKRPDSWVDRNHHVLLDVKIERLIAESPRASIKFEPARPVA